LPPVIAAAAPGVDRVYAGFVAVLSLSGDGIVPEQRRDALLQEREDVSWVIRGFYLEPRPCLAPRLMPNPLNTIYGPADGPNSDTCRSMRAM
jgi:hypothetical protein